MSQPQVTETWKPLTEETQPKQGLGVVMSQKHGKEVTYAATDAGRAYVQRYRDIRESCLIDALKADDGLNRDIGELARLLRVLSGMYDQAARAAASL